MGRYTGLPMVNILFLRPRKASFTHFGAGIDGGDGISIETAGGGRIRCTYESCFLDNVDTERHEIINWIGARGTGGFRFFNVPIINDGIGPFPIINGRRRPIVSGIPHSDGSLFSDGSGYSQATVYGEIIEVVHSGIIKMRAYDLARDLRWSDWLSINHPIKGHRAYRYWDVLEKSAAGSEFTNGAERSFKDYTLAMAPPLREAVTVGTRVELARPTCAMKFPQGFVLPWEFEANYQSRPTLEFVEAF